MSNTSLIQSFRDAGQAQVFAFFDQLAPDEREQLLSQAAEIDLDEIARLKRTLIDRESGESANTDFSQLAPASYERLPSSGGDTDLWAKAREAGEAALREGRVAAFTVAGGQGTRLGYDGPKGTFPVTPVTNKSLFEVFAEKIRAAGQRFGTVPLWFIMTSHQNHEATETFFREHEFFGLDASRVHFFRQGRMPAVDLNGKILLESKRAIALSPDGHGGSFRALERSGALDVMEREGVDTISYFQVDNPLVQTIDPTFLGWHLMRGSQMSSKAIPKAYAEEKLGHFCLQDGKLVVVEYSDLPMEMQRETDPQTGQLRFEAGSIAIHVLDRDFVRQMASSDTLPFHRADKKIPTVDEQGRPVKPDAPNGVKFELFVFDALPFASHPVVVETRRDDEFSPVKNAEGLDSPQTSRADQVRQWTRWAKAAGADVPTDENGDPRVNFEVSPLFVTDEESFAASWNALKSKPQIADGLVLNGSGPF